MEDPVSFFSRGSLLFLLGAAMAFSAPSDTLPLPSVLKGDSVPWFAVRTGESGENPFTRSSLLGLVKPGTKRVAFVYFATWCLPCREGMTRLSAQKENLDRHGIQVFLVNIGERDLKKVSEWVKLAGASDWPIVFDFFGRLTTGFGLVSEGKEVSLPRILLMDSHLKPLRLFCTEGDDWPSVLWEK